MTTKTPIAFLISGALALGIGACGGDDEEPAGGGGGGAEPVAQVDKLTGVSTSVALDAAFVEALTMLKVTPGPVGDAKITKAGEAVFPITGGNVTYYEPGTESPSVQGIINHEGSGLSLEAGGTLVELENFDVDPGGSVLTGDVSVDGEVAAEDAELFFLDGRTLNPLEVDKEKNTATLEGTTVKLKQSAADLLNKTFKIDALAGDLPIGIATIEINAS